MVDRKQWIHKKSCQDSGDKKAAISIVKFDG